MSNKETNKNLPETLFKPNWILCSEKLPDDDRQYLITDGTGLFKGSYIDDDPAFGRGWLTERTGFISSTSRWPILAWTDAPEMPKLI